VSTGAGGFWSGIASRLRPRPATPLAEATFVVLDTETSGLDTARDRLLSIGACVVSAGTLPLASSFYRVLRQERVSDDANILVHGIGGEAQLAGESQAEALTAFLAFAGDHPLVAFNAPFDHAFLAAAIRRQLGLAFRPDWIDLALLPAALYPPGSVDCRTLDDWLEHFSLAAPDRHNALGDAYSTAQLLLAMLAKARSDGITDLSALRSAQRHGRWLGGRKP
jgi:DNA polymerase-3 subunit epsilon